MANVHVDCDVHFICADVGFWRSSPFARLVCVCDPPQQTERCCAAACPNEINRDLDCCHKVFSIHVSVDCRAACYAEDGRAAAPQEYCAAQIWASNLIILYLEKTFF